MNVAEIFKFFNSAPGDERWHYASDFAEYFGDVLSSGLIHKNNVPGLQVTVVPNSLKTKVDVGQALIKGYSYQNTAPIELNHDITDIGLNRIDRIVLRLDLYNANRFIKVFVKKGVEAVSPVAPALQRDQYIYELSLAQVRINSNSTVINPTSLVDERMKEDLCGVVHSLISVPTSVFQQQWDYWFNVQSGVYTAELLEWVAEQKVIFNSWKTNEESSFSKWNTGQKSDFADWRDQQTEAFNLWKAQEQEMFNAWFATLENLLDENVAATLTAKVLTLEDDMTSVNQKLNAHLAETITSDKGLHDQIRYKEKKLQIKIDGAWTDYKSGTQIAVKSVSDFTAAAGNAKVTLTWQDPVDVEVDGAVLARWKGTRIVRKTGSYPQNENDGVAVVQNGVRNQYNTNGYVDTGLMNDTTYYYSAFAYNVDDVFSSKVDVAVTPKSHVIYGVKIDTTNSNPETAVSYIEQSTGFTPAKGNNGNFIGGSWLDKFPFNLVKPCVVKNKTVQYYLNPNDYTKKLDGTVADITSGNDGDVMVEFPKVFWKFETIGTDLYIRISDTKVDAGYKPLAHTRGVVENDKTYIGAYLGYSLSSKLRSLSGKMPTVNQTISAFRTLAQANGAGYEQMPFYQLSLMQVLSLIMFKNRDMQTALGRGFVDGNSGAIATGGTDKKGMFFGETTGKMQNKFCGVEDFWGNCFYWIDGLFCDANRNLLIGNNNFNNTGSGYTNYGQGASTNLGGYISGVQGGTETAFIPKIVSGSETTHYSDYGNLSASYLPRFGSNWSHGSYAGAFLLYVNDSASGAYSSVGARLALF